MKVYVVQRYEDDLLIFATKEAAEKFARNDEFITRDAADWVERASDLGERFPTIPIYAKWRAKTKEELLEEYFNDYSREEEVIE